MKASFIATCALGFGLVSSAFAATPEQALASLSHGHVKFVKSFAGPSKNVEGFIGKSNDHQFLMWLIDGKYVVTGPLLSLSGEDLSHKAAIAQGLLLAPRAVLDAVRKAPGFTVGKSGPEVFMFADPNCIWCHRTWMALKPAVAEGKLRIRVIPVAFLKTSSADKAAAILAAQDRAQAWSLDEEKFDEKTEEGGIQPHEVQSPSMVRARKEAEANTKLWQRSGANGTPAFVTCDAKGKISVRPNAVLPQQVDAFIAGLAACK